jgi:hypothetical protein
MSTRASPSRVALIGAVLQDARERLPVHGLTSSWKSKEYREAR